MDGARKGWHFSDMEPIPVWQLYGESLPFPDALHIERVVDRAAGLDWTIAPHRHLHLHQIFLLTAGGVRLSLDGLPQALSLPVCVNVPRGAVHGFSFAAGTEGYVLTLPAEGFPALFGPGAEPAALARPLILPAWGLEPGFAQIAALHRDAVPLRHLQLTAAATLLACRVAAAAPPGGGDAATGPDPRLLRFEALVRARLRERPPMTEIARELGLSPRHLSRLIHAATGQSAQGHAEALVMHEACRLLVYTRMSVQQVAFHLGYDDPSYFTRAFRRRTGRSPTDYRARFDAAA